MSYFYTSLETSEKLWFSDIFRGYRNGTSACKSKAIRNRVYYLRILYIEFIKIQSNSSTLRIWDKILKCKEICVEWVKDLSNIKHAGISIDYGKFV